MILLIMIVFMVNDNCWEDDGFWWQWHDHENIEDDVGGDSTADWRLLLRMVNDESDLSNDNHDVDGSKIEDVNWSNYTAVPICKSGCQ